MRDTTDTTELSRRTFVVTSAIAGAGLLLGVRIRDDRARSNGSAPSLGSEPFAPNAWIKLDETGDVTILVHKSEMGQGVWTALPMIVAEEMDADWRRVRAERAPTRPDLDTATGGSSSIRESWQPLRRAGATARAMLVAAAAKRWGVPERECATSVGEVVHTRTRRRLGYGALAREAATMPPPDEKSLTLKDPRTFRIVGRDTRRLDTPAKVTGKASFGIDVKVPGMLVAVVARCPTFAGKVASVDDSRARAVSGVRHVLTLDPVPKQLPGRVAVLADDTWSAMQGRKALDIQWDLGEQAAFSSDAMWQEARRAVDEGTDAKINRAQGDTTVRQSEGTRTVEATYELPFLAHACMEPMNCTASVTADKVELWLPSQFPEPARGVAARLANVPLDHVEAHVTFMGGGFGRRAYQDFVVEAVQLSQRAGAPVKVVWTREDDIQHDMYRPAQLQSFRASLDANGRLITLQNRIVGPSTEAWWNPATTTPQRREGGETPPYDYVNTLNDFVRVPAPVPLGAWRAVQNGQNGFCFESFIDECAHAMQIDPVAYRLMLLGPNRPRQQAVVRLAAEKARWGTPLPRGRGRGIAFFDYDGTYVAEVAEVTVTKRDGVHVDRVVCAFDCGTIVNPDTVRAQAESAVIWATSAALFGEITMKDGRTVQSNFHDYRVLRMADSPAVEVHLVRNNEIPTGVGEPAVPPLGAAIANAIFAATGQRLRKTPFRLADLNIAAM
ncbi:MAG TPA: molybdopterin cofactor-binding domain-containing protein [Gemmatimonadaceae bacterium]|jgi:isoquinoline 1-oxidoreductase beta subunit